MASDDLLFTDIPEFAITGGVFNNVQGNQINTTIITSANSGWLSSAFRRILASFSSTDYVPSALKSDEEAPAVRAKSSSYTTAVFACSHALPPICADSPKSDYT
jgi:hypothetical protein